MDAACTIQDSIHVFSLVRKYVSRILGTYQKEIFSMGFLLFPDICRNLPVAGPTGYEIAV